METVGGERSMFMAQVLRPCILFGLSVESRPELKNRHSSDERGKPKSGFLNGRYGRMLSITTKLARKEVRQRGEEGGSFSLCLITVGLGYSTRLGLLPYLEERDRFSA